MVQNCILLPVACGLREGGSVCDIVSESVPLYPDAAFFQ